MRFTVSVPDELWASAVEAAHASSPSAVVQMALRRLVDDRPAEQRLAPDLATRRRAHILGKTLASAARQDFAQGYEGGLDFAKRAAYSDIEALHLAQYNLERWMGKTSRRFIDLIDIDEDDERSEMRYQRDVLNELGAIAYRYTGVDARQVPGAWSEYREAYDTFVGNEDFDQWVARAVAELPMPSDALDSPSARMGFVQALRDVWEAGDPDNTDEEEES